MLYAATLDAKPAPRKCMQQAAKSGATLVVTDSDESASSAGTPSPRTPATRETASENPPYDPTEEPIDHFLPQTSDSQTVTVFEGVKSVVASDYGNDLQFLPEDRAAVALDGDTQTAWQTSAFANPVGQWWQVDARPPHHDRPRQPAAGDKRLPDTLDHQRHPDVRRQAQDQVALGPASRSRSPGAGQTVTLPATDVLVLCGSPSTAPT